MIIIIIYVLVWSSKGQFSGFLLSCGLVIFSIIGTLNTLWMFRLYYSIELFRGEEEKNLMQNPTTTETDSTNNSNKNAMGNEKIDGSSGTTGTATTATAGNNRTLASSSSPMVSSKEEWEYGGKTE